MPQQYFFQARLPETQEDQLKDLDLVETKELYDLAIKNGVSEEDLLLCDKFHRVKAPPPGVKASFYFWKPLSEDDYQPSLAKVVCSHVIPTVTCDPLKIANHHAYHAFSGGQQPITMSLNTHMGTLFIIFHRLLPVKV
jgi:hypothetical protein